ncbi:hypothetical protein GCM10018966_093650 [Streptomyces yanii]
MNTIVSAAAGLPAPRVTLVLNFTVLKVLSMGFVVRRCTQAGLRSAHGGHHPREGDPESYRLAHTRDIRRRTEPKGCPVTAGHGAAQAAETA